MFSGNVGQLGSVRAQHEVLFLLSAEISKPQNTTQIPDIAQMLGELCFYCHEAVRWITGSES